MKVEQSWIKKYIIYHIIFYMLLKSGGEEKQGMFSCGDNVDFC